MYSKGGWEGRGGGSESSDLDLDPDPWELLWIQIRIRQNDMDPLDPDTQHFVNQKRKISGHHVFFSK